MRKISMLIGSIENIEVSAALAVVFAPQMYKYIA